MARIIYSALVESIAGSIKGTTFQRNAYGYTVKGKPNMVNPSRLSQQLNKLHFAANARKWRTITDTNRTQWQSYADAFPIPTRLNPASNLSGFDYFLKYHNWVSLTDPSVLLANPGTTQNAFEIDQIEIILSGGSLFVEVAMIDSDSTMRMLAFLTSPIPMGREFINITPRFVGNANETSGSFTANCSTRYVEHFGTLPSVGKWLGLKLVFYRSNNAQMILVTPTQVEVIL
jgi:hypothetical protein